MANGHGGARPGSGQKKKPLAEKIVDGNPGRRPLEVVAFPTADLRPAGGPGRAGLHPRRVSGNKTTTRPGTRRAALHLRV